MAVQVQSVYDAMCDAELKCGIVHDGKRAELTIRYPEHYDELAGPGSGGILLW